MLAKDKMAVEEEQKNSEQTWNHPNEESCIKW